MADEYRRGALKHGDSYTGVVLQTRADALSNAVALLAELEPVKPITDKLAPDGTYTINRCGGCKNWLRIGDKFCGRCGRKVMYDAAD
jgi:rRNA maturation endonuclease Nob1